MPFSPIPPTLMRSSKHTSAYKNRQYNGTYLVQELRDYFWYVEFELTEDEWRDMGLGIAADVLPMISHSGVTR